MKTIKLFSLFIGLAFVGLFNTKAVEPVPTLDNLPYYMNEIGIDRFITTFMYRGLDQADKISTMYDFGYAAGVFSYLFNQNQDVLANFYYTYTAYSANLPYPLTPEYSLEYKSLSQSYLKYYNMFVMISGQPLSNGTIYLQWYIGYYQAITDCINYNTPTVSLEYENQSSRRRN